MKVVLLESGRGNQAPLIADWREKLGLHDADSIALLSWYPPREPLPVALHVVFGPRMWLRTRARSGAVLLDEIRRIRAAEERRRHDQGLDLDEAYDADAEDAAHDMAQEQEDLAEQLPESMVGTSGTVSLDQPVPVASAGAQERQADAQEAIEEILETAATESTQPELQQHDERSSAPADAPATRMGTDAVGDDVLNLPYHHPDRIKTALRWRARKVYFTAKRSYPVRKGRVVVRKAIGGIPSEFAAAMASWKGASVVVGNADLVLSLDSRSQKAAWVLARRVQGPAVVSGFPAAIRVLHQRRAEQAERA